MAARIVVALAPGLSAWSWSDPDEPYVIEAGAPHEIEDPSPELARAVGAAIAAGSLELVSADAPTKKTLGAAAESEGDSLAFKEKADAIRAEFLPARDEALELAALRRGDKLLAAEAEVEAGDAAEEWLEGRRAEIAGEHEQEVARILASHDDVCDAAIRERLGKEG